MSHQVKFEGRYVSPEQAAKELRPLDTYLICPECESTHVVSGEARLSTRIGKEFLEGIPRQQDRRCLACGHLWTVVLPPLSYAATTIIPGLGR